jgi:amino acid transporter
VERREDEADLVAEDVRTLHRLGYAQELRRRMSGFSNFAISLSIICILAGCITSFHLGLCSVGGASFGLGWPLVCLFALAVAASMGQVASAFPTAGGLYHWASILGGKGWGWATAWFNLAGLVIVLAAINVGTCDFVFTALGASPGPYHKLAAVAAVTLSQGLVNHLGIRLTTLLTDFSGYWILLVSVVLTASCLAFASTWEPARLVTFTNYSGLPSGDAPVWPASDSLVWLFALGFLLPAYTVTGFDASAHTAEETVGAAVRVPRGIVHSVLVSGLFGWAMLCAVVLAIPDMDVAAQQGANAFVHTIDAVLPRSLALALYAGISVAQYLCGLAAVTSASRMAYAFARDRGLPFSSWMRHVSPTFRTPVAAIWTVAVAAVLFTVHVGVYSTITVAAALFLYVSYAVPIALGLVAYGRSWTKMGPWSIGWAYRPLAAVSVAGCVVLIAIGMAPPNEAAVWLLAGACVVLLVVWFGIERWRFPGPPVGVLSARQMADIERTEKALAEGGSPQP